MKAAVVAANEDVRYMDVEEPQVTDGTVKVKVAVSGICGSDIPRVLHNGVHFYPIVLGHEFSGEVVEVGEGVTTVKVGRQGFRRAADALHEMRRLPAGELRAVQALQLHRLPPAGKQCANMS